MPPHPDSRIRRLLLALIVIGIAGLAVELALLEHTESATQWIPFAALGAALVTVVAVAARGTRATVRAMQGVMAACVAVGVLGLWLHYRGNVEFELETDPSLRGLALVWEALRGATPALAPGALAQLGLLGLLYTYRHPALDRQAPDLAGARGAGSNSQETQ
ncbi:MAG TPA: hypothetical protein VFS05_00445 [Gemmatimonadaceae bacterium]|nr:hypothetical protein [Gemmatimonadaceae bacterium]